MELAFATAANDGELVAGGEHDVLQCSRECMREGQVLGCRPWTAAGDAAPVVSSGGCELQYSHQRLREGNAVGRCPRRAAGRIGVARQLRPCPHPHQQQRGHYSLAQGHSHERSAILFAHDCQREAQDRQVFRGTASRDARKIYCAETQKLHVACRIFWSAEN